MSELDPLDKRLNMAWQALSPPAELAARVRARLDGTSAAAGAATLGGRVASRWRALRASGLLGAGAGALLLGAGIALGYLLPRAPVPAAPDSRAPAVSQTPALPAIPPAAGTSAPPSTVPASRAATAPSGPAATAPSPRQPSAPARARAHAPRPAAAADADPGAELQLLERAERAVRSRNPALALALIAELEQRFPRSPLHEERRAIELMAHCQAQSAGADAPSDSAGRFERFARRYPESVYSERIADECGAARSTPTLTNSTAPDIDRAEGDDDARDNSP
jgi:hypothetical protein